MTKTTDIQNEIFDVVDEEDNIIGQAKRGEVHGNPKLIHRSIGVVIFNRKGEIFLQQRSKTKDVDPGKWTVSCSGHLSSASSTVGGIPSLLLGATSSRFNRDSRGVLRRIYEEAAHRELGEELGVDLKIISMTKFIYRSETETEMAMIFQAYFDGPFQLNKEEISQGKFFTRKELNRLIKSGKIDMSKEGKMALTKMGVLD